MELQLNIDPQKINEFMANKLIESTLGAQVKKAIEEKFKDFEGYNSPVKALVSQYVSEAIRAHLNTTYKDQIMAAVEKAIDVTVITNLTAEFVSKLKLESRY